MFTVNFALILFVLCLITGSLWFADLLYYKKRRAKGAPDPLWVVWGADFFVVIFLVFFLRSFVAEPFRIPSASMRPTLIEGDFILVNKFTYGIRLPVINQKIIAINTPARGDTFVFRFPEDESQDYIKRVVGLPGDKIAYQNKRLTINGEALAIKEIEKYSFGAYQQFVENLGGEEHRLLIEEGKPAFVSDPHDFANRKNCFYNNEGFICTVPEGHYFAMGDNRDNSSDSRIWGFVPDKNLVGKAFFIWLNFGDFSRIGAFH